MAIDPAFWRGKRVFVTGHTGFKGSWLCIWLQLLRAELTGYALPPSTSPSLFEVAAVARDMTSIMGDVRDAEHLRAAVISAKPEIVIHMAAQPLVRLSYKEPVETFATNVMGTVHLFEAVRQCPGVRAVVNVTSDKCYEPAADGHAHRETDPMGGHDPYSSSKGCAELVTSAYQRSFFTESACLLASGRAGNVIGGGDWAEDRLVPDVVRAAFGGQPVSLRNPAAVRPWQHVLEPLSGYLMLSQRLFEGDRSCASGWNFGPDPSDTQPVSWIAAKLSSRLAGQPQWQHDQGEHPAENAFLTIDSTRAREELHWSPRWSLPTALETIAHWHLEHRAGADMRALCEQQIASYENARP